MLVVLARSEGVLSSWTRLGRRLRSGGVKAVPWRGVGRAVEAPCCLLGGHHMQRDRGLAVTRKIERVRAWRRRQSVRRLLSVARPRIPIVSVVYSCPDQVISVIPRFAVVGGRATTDVTR